MRKKVIRHKTFVYLVKKLGIEETNKLYIDENTIYARRIIKMRDSKKEENITK